MRDFACPNCGQHLAFENSVCLSCGSALGFSLDDMALMVIASGEGAERGGAVVSSYAAMHPAEDWAETFAHYLHIRDTLDTAAAFGFAAAAATFERRVLGPSGFDTIIAMWLPLVWALNMVNRSMGRDDLYPFVLPAAVLEKVRFIHNIIAEVTSDPAKLASAGMTRTSSLSTM
jgi:hypothetical protein